MGRDLTRNKNKGSKQEQGVKSKQEQEQEQGVTQGDKGQGVKQETRGHPLEGCCQVYDCRLRMWFLISSSLFLICLSFDKLLSSS